VGVELSDIAVAAFFAEHELEFDREPSGPLDRYTAKNYPITVYCGDYFSFESATFDALYDRGALVALPPDQRLRYVEHTRQLLRADATRLVITLEYDQQVVNGPPFSVLAEELAGYWDDLVRVGEKSDIENCPPKFRKAGLTDILEVVWLSR
jgi:thiopurine S-methyltransferase